MDKSFDIASIKTLLNSKGNLNHFEENIKMTTCLHQEQYSLKLQSKPFLYRNHSWPQDVSRDLRCLHTLLFQVWPNTVAEIWPWLHDEYLIFLLLEYFTRPSHKDECENLLEIIGNTEIRCGALWIKWWEGFRLIFWCWVCQHALCDQLD